MVTNLQKRFYARTRETKNLTRFINNVPANTVGDCMRKVALFLVLAFLGVVLAGCLGPSAPANTGNQGASGQVAGEQGQSEGNPLSGIIGPNGQIDMSKITSLGDLAKLGQGIKCVGEQRITDESGTRVEHVDYWVKGNNWKMVITTGSGENQETETVIHANNNLYLSMEGLPKGCDMVVLPNTGSTNIPPIGTHQISFTTPDNMHVDNSWSCHVEAISDNDLKPQGHACTIQEVIQLQMQQAAS